MNDHPRTVDVAYLKQRCLGAAHAGSVEKHQNGAMHQVRGSLDHPCYFLRTQHDWKLPGSLWKDQVVVGDIARFQGLLVEKTQRRNTPLDRAGRELLIPEQMQLELSNLLPAQMLRRLAEVIRKLLDRM